MDPAPDSKTSQQEPAPRGSRGERFRSIRLATCALAAPLSAEDCAIQSMPDASPVKWHLAHTTWFFETFVLAPHQSGYRAFDAAYGYLFNSYYNAIGARHPRPERGLLSRPGLEEILAYRRHVDAAMLGLLAGESAPPEAGGPGRTRAAARAAAPGIAAHRPSPSVFLQSAGAGLSASAAAGPGRRCRGTGLAALRRRSRRDRPRRPGLCLRQ
jgi:hypothetical protein